MRSAQIQQRDVSPFMSHFPADLLDGRFVRQSRPFRREAAQFLIASPGEAVAESVRTAQKFARHSSSESHRGSITAHGDMKDALAFDRFFNLAISTHTDPDATRLSAFGIGQEDFAAGSTSQSIERDSLELFPGDAAGLATAGASFKLDTSNHSQFAPAVIIHIRNHIFGPKEMPEVLTTSGQGFPGQGAQLGVERGQPDTGRVLWLRILSTEPFQEGVFQLAKVRGLLFPAVIGNAFLDAVQKIGLCMCPVDPGHVLEIKHLLGEMPEPMPGVFAVAGIGIGMQCRPARKIGAARREGQVRQGGSRFFLVLVPAGSGFEYAGFHENTIDLIVHASAHGFSRSGLYTGRLVICGVWPRNVFRIQCQDVRVFRAREMGKSARPTALRSWELCSRRLPSYALLSEVQRPTAFVPIGRQGWPYPVRCPGPVRPSVEVKPVGGLSTPKRNGLTNLRQVHTFDAVHQVMDALYHEYATLSTVTLKYPVSLMYQEVHG